MEEAPVFANEEPEVLEEQEPENLLDILRQERREGLENQETIIPVPGYETLPLFIKYRMMDGQELMRITRKTVKSARDRWERQLTAAIDVMIAAAVGVVVEHDGKMVDLTYEGQPILGYTEELAASLGFEAGSARKVVFGTFIGRELAIADHSMRLQRWFAGNNSSFDEDFLGE